MNFIKKKIVWPFLRSGFNNWLLALLGIGMTFPGASFAQNKGGASVLVQIGSSSYFEEYVLGEGSVKKLPSVCESEGQACPRELFVGLIKERSSRRIKYAKAAFDKKGRIPVAAKWVDWSSDNKYLIYGFDDLELSPAKGAEVVDVNDGRVVYKFNGVGSIECFQWFEDSSKLVILESREHLKKTPLGLIAALGGHGVEVAKYFVEVIPLHGEDVPSIYELPSSFEGSSACVGLRVLNN